MLVRRWRGGWAGITFDDRLLNLGDLACRLVGELGITLNMVLLSFLALGSAQTCLDINADKSVAN